MKLFPSVRTVTLLITAAFLAVTTGTREAHAEKLRALFGDGSVRFASSGPFGLGQEHHALIGLLLPAVRRARATVHIVDNKGKILKTKEIDIPTDQIPTDQNPAFWSISLKLSVDQSNNIVLNDGSTDETIGSFTASEHVSILIGLLLPAVQKVRDAAARQHTASVQLVSVRSGEINFILPFIEQSVLVKNVALGR